MSNQLPLVSVIITAYNRATTIERSIDSTLKQTYKNIEIVVIDDGSTDGTISLLNEKVQNNPTVRLYKHAQNKGAGAAKNLGLDNIRGEWFTFLDSDDEMIPTAIETMIKIPLEEDLSVTAVTCNCWDTTLKTFAGRGLQANQYLDDKTIMTKCSGDFWGITKKDLLRNDRFNEKIKGFEDILWSKINDRAKRYYIHTALSIIHTEGQDRITKSKNNLKDDERFYEAIIEESEFLNKLLIHQPQKYSSICKNGVLVMKATSKNELASAYYKSYKKRHLRPFLYLAYKSRFVSLLLLKIKVLIHFVYP